MTDQQTREDIRMSLDACIDNARRASHTARYSTKRLQGRALREAEEALRDLKIALRLLVESSAHKPATPSAPPQPSKRLRFVPLVLASSPS